LRELKAGAPGLRIKTFRGHTDEIFDLASRAQVERHQVFGAEELNAGGRPPHAG
jgi:hypothetical protein